MAKKQEQTSKPKKVIRKSFFDNYRWETMIFVFAFLLYTNCIPNGYNMDDELVTNNHRLTSKGISAIPEIFTSAYYKDDMGYAYEYRPVVLTSFAIEHQLFGDNAPVSHFFNVLLYALCCVLLFRVLQLVFKGLAPLLSLAITILFIVHPAHTEVVASIKNRDEIFALILGLLTLYTAVKATVPGKKWLLVLLPIIFSVALMSKITAVTFMVIVPAVLILFTEAGFITVMIVALLLTAPAFFLVSNVGQIKERLNKEICVLIGIGSLYLIVNIKTVYFHLTLFVKSATDRSDKFSSLATYGQLSKGFGDILTGIEPDPSVFSFAPVAIATFATVIFFTGVAFGYNVLVIAGALVLFVVAIWGIEQFSWWSNVMIYFCLVFAMVKYDNLIITMYGDLIFMPLICQVLFGNRKLFIPSALILVCLFVLAIFLNPMMAISIALFIVVLRWKHGWVVVIPILFGQIHEIKIIYNQPWNNFCDMEADFYANKISLLTILWILLKRETKYLLWVYKFGAVALLIFFIGSNPLKEIATVNYDFGKNVNDYTAAVKIDGIVQEQNRPLLYLEQPVTIKDPWQIRVGTSLEILLQYLHKVVLPYPMAFYYGYRFIKPMDIKDTVPVIGLIFYAILFMLAAVFIWKDRVVGLGLMIYLISVLAVSNFFAPVPGQIGERFLLVPTLGWSIVLASILLAVFGIERETAFVRWSVLDKNARYVFLAIMLFYSGLTFSRNLDWKDDLTLFRHDITYVDQSAQAHNLLGTHLMLHVGVLNGNKLKQQEYEREALSHFKRAYEIYSDFFNVAFDLGLLYSALNEYDSAVFYFRTAIAIDSTKADAYLNIGKIFMGQQKFSEAVPYFERMTIVDSLNYGAYDNLSFAYFGIKEYEKSLAVNKVALTKLPMMADPLINIGRTFVAMNQNDSARVYFQRALQVSPGNQAATMLLNQLPRTSR